MIRRLLTVCAAVSGAVLLAAPPPASAHPLGNFTVNQHAGLVVEPSAVSVELVVDMAEIPAFQTREEIDRDGDKEIAPAEASDYRTARCEDLGHGIVLRVGGRLLAVDVASTTLRFPPGQAGLPTLRLTCELRAAVPDGTTGRRLDLENSNYRDRVGWAEVTATGAGVRLVESDVPAESPSGVLRAYPEDLLSSPLDVRDAHLVVGTGGPAGEETRSVGAADGRDPVSVLPRGADTLGRTFTDLVSRQDFSVWFALFALGSAVGLGALHALAPGHGKSVMAAYLVGERGSLRQAVLLGASVTATHTAGVLVLGVLLSGSAVFVPERIYPWLGVISGAILAAIGVSLLSRAWRRRGAIVDGHHHGHHHGHDHAHPGRVSHGHDETVMSRRALITMGAAGGMVPSPSALVVLLGAIALGRTWFGIALVLGYGVGMAVTLVAAGLLLVRARSSLDRRLLGHGRATALVRALPILTASLVVVAGVGMAGRAVTQI